MSIITQSPVANAEAIAAWDGPLFDRFVQFRQIVTTGLGAHGEHALRLHPPQPAQPPVDGVGRPRLASAGWRRSDAGVRRQWADLAGSRSPPR
jgi:hypothetical protein